MSFAGTVSAMITSLKNNARQRKSLYGNKLIFKKTKKNKLKFPDIKATPEQLEKIRREAQKEHRTIIFKRITALLISLLLIGTALWFTLSYFKLT